MILIHDHASLAHALTLNLTPQLRRLLAHRIDALVTVEGDLTDWTEFLILQPSDREHDIVREIGFSPLVEPIDGARFGGRGFSPF